MSKNTPPDYDRDFEVSEDDCYTAGDDYKYTPGEPIKIMTLVQPKPGWKPPTPTPAKMARPHRDRKARKAKGA